MPPRPRKPSEKLAPKLLEAVRFVSSILKDEGAPYETHLLMSNKTITAFNGVIAAGQLIDENLICAPHAKIFLNALSKCGENYSLTQLDQSKLAVKSGKFKAVIPCIDPSNLSNPIPDAINCSIDDSFKEALLAIEVIKPELNAQSVYLLAFLLNGQSILSTDGKILIECWHGLNLPSGLSIPKAFIPIITEQSKKLTSFGLGSSSVTLYYEDGSWFRTQLYSQEWPIETVTQILNKQSNPQSIPIDFFEGIAKINSFSEGILYFDDGLIRTHLADRVGATYIVEGLKKGPAYSEKYLSMIKGIAEKIDFYANEGKILYFFGKNLRGVVMGMGR